jgi:hypothetical protein
MENRESNNTLYFIVGGLLVLVAVFGFMFYNGNLSAPSPAAGNSTAAVETDTTRTDFQVNEKGFSSTVTESSSPASE